jgi:hypothetical protein
MTVTELKKQILRIENALQAVKKRAFAGKPDFEADERVWNAVRRDVKQARADVYQRAYGGRKKV